MTRGGMPCRVFVATTAVPVEVQRITEEDPSVNSVVCLKGKAVALPISAAYDDFVRDPTGVVQRRYGHPAYRIDVSETIENGYSWQLGFFVAHALSEAGRLAPGEEGARRLIATGEVDRDLKVGPVDHVARKLERLLDLAQETPDLTAGAVFYLPEANVGDIPELLASRAKEAGLEIHSVSTAEDVLKHAGVAAPAPAPKPPTRPEGAPVEGVEGKVPRRGERDRTGRFRIATWTLLAILLGAGAYVAAGPAPGWADLQRAGRLADLDRALSGASGLGERLQARLFRAWLEAQRPHPDAITVAVEERMAPEGARCREVAYGRVRPDRVPVARGGAAADPEDARGLCGVSVRVAGEDGVFIWGRAVKWARGKPDRDRPDSIMSLVRRQGQLTWKADLPPVLKDDITYRFVVLAASSPPKKPGAWARDIYTVGTAGPETPDAKRALARLGKAGITVKIIEHKIAAR